MRAVKLHLHAGLLASFPALVFLGSACSKAVKAEFPRPPASAAVEPPESRPHPVATEEPAEPVEEEEATAPSVAEPAAAEPATEETRRPRRPTAPPEPVEAPTAPPPTSFASARAARSPRSRPRREARARGASPFGRRRPRPLSRARGPAHRCPRVSHSGAGRARRGRRAPCGRLDRQGAHSGRRRRAGEPAVDKKASLSRVSLHFLRSSGAAGQSEG